MEKNKILRNQDNTKIIRILEVKESSFLVIDCIKRTMPQWNEYFCAAEPPVRGGVSHLSRRNEPLYN